jgi:hypothetical protein
MTGPSGTDPRLGALLDRLLYLTRDKAIHWKKSTNRRGSPEPFSVNLTGTTARIRSADDDELPPYVVEILDSSGIVVQTISRALFSSDPEAYRRYGEVLSELYRLARYEALDVDNVIDRMLQELGEESGEK